MPEKNRFESKYGTIILKKSKKKYRNRLLIRASKSMTIQNNLSKALKKFKIQPEIKLTVDVDPISFN